MRHNESLNDPQDSFSACFAINDARLGRAEQLTALMREHNQRMFRIARSILKNDAEAEDIVQESFIKVFTDMDSLKKVDNLSAWLAKVTANLAISRLRHLKYVNKTVKTVSDYHEYHQYGVGSGSPYTSASEFIKDPEQSAAINDVRHLIEQEIDRLPNGFREVFVLREIEQMSILETAELLDIRPQTVKTRLHRAKKQLRRGLKKYLTKASLSAFPFAGIRCRRTTIAVVLRLRGHNVISSNDSLH